jgi:hypothetical protein
VRIVSIYLVLYNCKKNCSGVLTNARIGMTVDPPARAVDGPERRRLISPSHRSLSSPSYRGGVLIGAGHRSLRRAGSGHNAAAEPHAPVLHSAAPPRPRTRLRDDHLQEGSLGSRLLAGGATTDFDAPLYDQASYQIKYSLTTCLNWGCLNT